MRLALAMAPILMWALCGPARATPHWSDVSGEACQTCHVDGPGGGRLTPWGARFAAERLPAFGAVPGPARVSKRPPSFDFGGAVRLRGGAEVDATAPELALDRLAASAVFRPYNPPGDAEGRLALLLTAEATDVDLGGGQLRLPTYGLVFDDLLFGAAARLGRFRPALAGEVLGDGGAFGPLGDLGGPARLTGGGWRLYGASLTPGRTALGLFLGATPGPVALTAELYAPADGALLPAVDAQAGLVSALSATYRAPGLSVGLGATSLFGARGELGSGATARPRDDGQSLAARLGFALAPFSYAGEYALRRGHAGGPGSPLGLAASHIVTLSPTQGLDASLGYDWQDPDTGLRYDSRHLARLGLDARPWPGLGVGLLYAHAWQYGPDRFAVGDDRVALCLRAWL